MIPLQSPCVSTQMGGITGGYKILILSTQVKQGKVHRILITPLQSHSKLHWKIPVFSLQCLHWNGWNHRGVNFFNPSTQFHYPLGWEGNWKKNPRAVLYMNLYEYQRSRLFIDLGLRSLRFNIFKLLFLRNCWADWSQIPCGAFMGRGMKVSV